MKFLYTNVELKLPSHLNYVAVNALSYESKKCDPITFAVTLAIAVPF